MKVLMLAGYDSSFFQNQMCEIESKSDVEFYFEVHVSSWWVFRQLRGDLSRIFSKTEAKRIPQERCGVTVGKGFPKELFTKFQTKSAYRKILKKYKNAGIDLIHAQNAYPSGYLARMLAKSLKVPYLITSHGRDTYRCFDDSLESVEHKPFNKAELTQWKLAAKKAAGVIAVSKPFADLMNQVVPNVKITVIQNSYNTALFKPGNKVQVRSELNILPDDVILIYAANLILSKRQDILIKALALVKNPKAKLYLAGAGNHRIRLENLVRKLKLSDRVVFLGSISQNSLAKYYQVADITVFPSIIDSFGISLVEAMACQCAAISTRTYGPLDIIDENETGLFVDFDSYEEIAEKVDYLINDPEKMQSMAELASTRVYEKYSKKNEELMQLYRSVVK